MLFSRERRGGLFFPFCRWEAEGQDDHYLLKITAVIPEEGMAPPSPLQVGQEAPASRFHHCPQHLAGLIPLSILLFFFCWGIGWGA